MQKTNKSSAAMKLGLAAVASLALTFGAVAPAFAADVQVGPSNIAPFEAEDGSNYTGWHIGSQPNADAKLDTSVSFAECSIKTLSPVAPSTNTHVQVLNGIDAGSRPTGAAAMAAFVNSTTITVLEDGVTIQIPVFELWNGVDVDFTTFRTVALNKGTYKLSEVELESFPNSWVSPGDKFSDVLLWMGEVEVEESIDGDVLAFQILGAGFTGNNGSAVSSMSFGGNTYFFGNGSCLPAAATPPTKIETAA